MTLNILWLWIAAGGATLTWSVHTFLGQIYIVPPLLTASIHPVPKYTHFYCWHLVTLMIAVMAGCYVWAALDPGAWELAVIATGTAVLACLWSVCLVATVRRHKPGEMPPWALFGVTSAAGLLAMVVT